MDPNTKERIERDVKNNRVFLYMKGTPAFPQCGFSQRVVQILRHYGVDFASANVLEDMSIREGIKEYSNWPTIPQLYVGGEFVGGCDILMELHERGELATVLKQNEGGAESAGPAS
jgi:monothiol glutaredoxin